MVGTQGVGPIRASVRQLGLIVAPLIVARRISPIVPTLTATKPPRPAKDTHRIQRMFAEISERYDLLNRVLSGGTDVAWRRLTAREALRPGDRMILDLACGTGDLALELQKQAPKARVIGADFTGPMLRLAQRKERTDKPISWIEADGLKLPFQSNTFDLITIAFGIRNMESLQGALKEILRVLKPGGRLAILEFSHPDNAIIRNLYMPYFLHVLPRIGAVLSQKSAYLYLPQSVLHFPNRRELGRELKQAGYARVRHAALSFGIAALHIADKAGDR